MKITVARVRVRNFVILGFLWCDLHVRRSRSGNTRVCTCWFFRVLASHDVIWQSLCGFALNPIGYLFLNFRCFRLARLDKGLVCVSKRHFIEMETTEKHIKEAICRVLVIV